uniref:Uncharacterized protein n=1 Tax=Ciona intestinalis TaxID=7719 RepID=H2XTG1_CIOIN
MRRNLVKKQPTRFNWDGKRVNENRMKAEDNDQIEVLLEQL